MSRALMVWMALIGAGAAVALQPRTAFARSLARRAPVVARAGCRLSESADALADKPDLDEYLARLWGSTEEELDQDVQRHHSIFAKESVVGAVEEERDEFALMLKLRRELGDADFKAIFGTAKVSGPSLDGGVVGR
ncbi:hypothetical protein KFE25_003820 [Diacronema lutheri]|uniref:Peptidyl-prolyl cis-trans isomerase n=1 Tax=Diacronema lutheri TaxID=2081491 RepID=A0A8J5XL39_DIALT|nr:hypothetical protein KFE25_003820 [Diacronema lutheri]|mmetsp:Transcript_10335/g.32633  ORF Transcript_10335/g.32633 Transcript_10335/m.32633 type:complete len:136 (-) Transcript_10335:656-1063(-)